MQTPQLLLDSIINKATSIKLKSYINIFDNVDKNSSKILIYKNKLMEVDLVCVVSSQLILCHLGDWSLHMTVGLFLQY